jgi:hypothetical protein
MWVHRYCALWVLWQYSRLKHRFFKDVKCTQTFFTRSSESSGMYCRVLNWMSTDVSEARAASIIRVMIALMEAARTSETSVNIQLRTRQYIPEDSELHTRRRENLKSHILHSFTCGTDVPGWLAATSSLIAKSCTWAYIKFRAGIFSLSADCTCFVPFFNHTENKVCKKNINWGLSKTEHFESFSLYWRNKVYR